MKFCTVNALALAAVFAVACVFGSPVQDGRGFIHPGAIHTSDDFARIKRQLQRKDPSVTAAWEALCRDNLAQADKRCRAFERVERGPGSWNYIPSAQAAACIYMNALRWKISGSEEHARNAVRNLMEWVEVNKGSGGGERPLANLVGGQFAQGAELLRDYPGWSVEDRQKCRRWLLEWWYPPAVEFLRWHNGQWLNADSWWGYRPGAFWSNWSLVNAYALVSIGIFCDDVYVYNLGLSYIKYDQVHGFTRCCGKKNCERCDCTEAAAAAGYCFEPAAEDVPFIYNDGIMCFWGFLFPVLHKDPRGPYGTLSQMQESGRDQGHCLMSIALASDIAQCAYNQGDDLFAYMGHRLAAGAEFVAAYNYAGADDLPWTEYRYADRMHPFGEKETWRQTGPSAQSRGGVRPIWQRIVGHYEGVKGVAMKYSRMGVEAQGPGDFGGRGGVTGYYDQLGYTVLTCTPERLCPPQKRPTELRGAMKIAGSKAIARNDLGGTVNDRWEKYKSNAVAKGTEIALMPLLPKGEKDTGKWAWNTGEKTRGVKIRASRSFVYRVEYTNARGVKSAQCFPIAVQGDSSEPPILQK